jgi:hypothetical protein
MLKNKGKSKLSPTGGDLEGAKPADTNEPMTK